MMGKDARRGRILKECKMAGMYGIEETKKVVDLGLAVGAAVKGALADGKIGLEDLGQLMALAQAFGAGMPNLSQAAKEVGDMQSQDAADLVLYVAGKVGQSKAEKVSVASLKLGHAVIALVEEIKAPVA